MDSSWLGLDEFFSSSSSRLSSRSRRSRISLDTSDFDLGLGDTIKVDFGLDSRDLGIGLGSRDLSLDSILREFDSFPSRRTAKSGASAASAAFPSKNDEREKHKEKEEREREKEKKKATESTRHDADYQTVRDLRMKLHHCQEEVVKLQSIIADLTQVNKRWQKYNSNRQIYVQNLLTTIHEQQEQINQIGERSCSSSGPESTDSSSEINADPEVERLRLMERKLKERVSVLEFQVKAHRDDWEAEVTEKKKALKDKEAAETRVAELMRELELLSGSGECSSFSEDERVELFCQNCGQMSEFEPYTSSCSRMYRTAVHLPCSSSLHSSQSSISTANDELVIDCGKQKKQEDLLVDNSKDTTKTWNIKADETSYSRASTVPLSCGPAQSLRGSVTNTTNSSASSVSDSCKPATLKSSLQIPIAKSSSVPEGSTLKFTDLSRMSLDSFKFSSEAPPVSVVHSSQQYDGTLTNSAENVICLRCGEIFPPDKHLMFLDHFPRCQSNRSHKLVSRDGTN